MNLLQLNIVDGKNQLDVVNQKALLRTEEIVSVVSKNIMSDSLFIESSKNFSQQMLDALMKKGYTKNNLAQELQISVSTLNRIARGVILQPTNKTFSRLLRLYCAILYS